MSDPVRAALLAENDALRAALAEVRVDRDRLIVALAMAPLAISRHRALRIHPHIERLPTIPAQRTASPRPRHPEPRRT